MHVCVDKSVPTVELIRLRATLGPSEHSVDMMSNLERDEVGIGKAGLLL